MKRLALVLAVSISALVSGAAVASVMASSGHSGGPDGRPDHHEAADEVGIHGGPIDRFHGSVCSLANVSGLQGNWTHGDYVSAVAVTGDSTLIVEAAHSDCGKPMVSVIHGTGNALMKTHKHESIPTPGS